MRYAPLASLGRYDKKGDTLHSLRSVGMTRIGRYDNMEEKPMFINKNKKLNNQGFTLIELTIVMAITAIISVMIVSFSVLISAQVKKNNLRADFLEDVISLRSDLQKQFAEAESDNPEFKIENYQFSTTENYQYIDDVTFSASGKILKVTVKNNSLNEEQSFILISKVD